MSKLLRRALKITVWPAMLMIAGKFLGILGISSIYDLGYHIDNQIDGIFSVQICYDDSATTLFVNSISDFIMILLLALPTIYLITKNILYQNTFQNPRTIIKMTHLNILKWVTKKDTSFLSIFIWSSFLLVASSIVVVHTIQNSTYTWTGILSAAFGILAIWGTVKTYETEVDKIYPKENINY